MALLCACSAVNTIPLDDAYIYPDKKAEATQPVQTAETAQPAQTVQTKTEPTMEIVSQKDTTITVRIKK